MGYISLSFFLCSHPFGQPQNSPRALSGCPCSPGTVPDGAGDGEGAQRGLIVPRVSTGRDPCNSHPRNWWHLTLLLSQPVSLGAFWGEQHLCHLFTLLSFHFIPFLLNSSETSGNRIIRGVNNPARAGKAGPPAAGSMGVFNTCVSFAAARQQLREQRLGFALLPLFFPPPSSPLKHTYSFRERCQSFCGSKRKAVSRDDEDNRREERVRGKGGRAAG